MMVFANNGKTWVEKNFKNCHNEVKRFWTLKNYTYKIGSTVN